MILLNKINYSDPKVFNLFCFCLNKLFLERVLGSRESFSPVDNFVVLLLNLTKLTRVEVYPDVFWLFFCLISPRTGSIYIYMEIFVDLCL